MINHIEIFVFGFILLVGLIGFSYMHEQVHVEINKDYNIGSIVEVQFPNLVTVGDSECPNDNCKLAHEINEAVSYPLLIIFAVIGVAFFIIILILVNIKLELMGE